MFHVEHAEDLARYLSQAAAAFSIPITPTQSQQFIEYARLLTTWNRTVNLTAITNPREVVAKHFIDSIAPLRFGLLTRPASVLDIGAGAGFPSIPLRIMRPDLRLTLLEPNSKKVSFLLYLVGTFQLSDVQVINQTLEQFARDTGERFDYVLVRALSLTTVANNLVDLLHEDGIVLAYRTTALEGKDIPLGLRSVNEWKYELPFQQGHRDLVMLKSDKATVPRGTSQPA